MPNGATKIPKPSMFRPEAISRTTAKRLRVSHLEVESWVTEASTIIRTTIRKVKSAQITNAGKTYSTNKSRRSVQPMINIASVSTNAIPQSRNARFLRFIGLSG